MEREGIYLVASLIGISSFFFRNMLFLRSLYLLSSILFIISGIIFNISIMIFMNCIYFLVNLFQIVRLLLERSTILLPEDLRSVYTEIFSIMKPREFLILMKLAEIKKVPKDTVLFHENQAQNILLLLLDGELTILKNTKKVASLKNFFYFVGEMRFLTQKMISTDVVSKTNVSYIEWSYEKLNRLKMKRPDIYMMLLQILGKDLIYKIQNQNKAALES